MSTVFGYQRRHIRRCPAISTPGITRESSAVRGVDAERDRSTAEFDVVPLERKVLGADTSEEAGQRL
jgi:hypothetical protein